ncbi:hypothetical protein PR048_021821 [Dryococelus australis]|uniref:Uncharacterized protein n=1 Tax=Dryococelus australis TaxID=614101 RepID=A0ABQ9GZ96_9NEOP|nr:hypothetical protein PR048_021821 [Dryococelus australis]
MEHDDYMIVAPTEPTFHSHKPNIEPVILDLYCTTSPQTLYQQRGFPVHDWRAYTTILDDILPDTRPISTTDEIDTIIKILTDTITEKIRQTTTFQNQPLFQDFKHLPEVGILIAHKREAHHEYQRSRTAANRAEYHRAKAKMRRKLNELRRQSWDSYISNAPDNANRM